MLEKNNSDKKFLITSRLKELPEKEDLLFAGSWCLDDEIRNNTSTINYQVHNHRWGNIENRITDSLVVSEIYEEILIDLSIYLNGYHNLSWSVRSWRIFVGPWIQKYITIIHDRWKTIEELESKYNVHETYIGVESSNSFKTSSYLDLSKKCKTVTWNKLLFDKILIYRGNISLTRQVVKLKEAPVKFLSLKSRKTFKSLAKCLIKRVISSNITLKFLQLCKRNDKLAMVQVYMSTKDWLFLKLRSRSIPLPDNIYIDPSTLSRIKEASDSRISEKYTDHSFKAFLYGDLLVNLPDIYLSDLEKLNNICRSSNIPTNPRYILTSISCWHNELFKFWTASRVDKGSYLVNLQHGGEYGTAFISFFEEHERMVSDKYLVWGWGSKHRKEFNIPITICNSKSIQITNSCNEILVVCNQFNASDYLTQMHSAAYYGDKNIEYINTMNKLLEKLSHLDDINITLRLFPGDKSLPDKLKWVDTTSNIAICRERYFADSLRKSLVVINTYPGTPFLESLKSNIPTMLLKSELDPFRHEASYYIKLLEQAEIIHLDVESIEKKIEQFIRTNPLLWWKKNDVMLARLKFVDKYAKGSSRPVWKDIWKILQESSSYS